MPAARRIFVCADDFAQDEARCRPILGLVEEHVLSAVSCFTEAPLWRSFGLELDDRAERIYLGLHLNLTEPFSLGHRPLSEWIARSLTGTVDTVPVRAHVQRQLDAFVDVIGRLPDFIDGHQHVHALPAIRTVVQDVVTALEPCSVRIRRLVPSFGRTDAPFKRSVIHRLATMGSDAGTDSRFYLNTAFAGDYSMRAAAGYGALFADWLAVAPDGGLIMCHPGQNTAAARSEEAFLRSRRYLDLFSQLGIELAGKPAACNRLLFRSSSVSHTGVHGRAHLA